MCKSRAFATCGARSQTPDELFCELSSLMMWRAICMSYVARVVRRLSLWRVQFAR